MKILRYFLIIALIALVVIQFIRPDKQEGNYLAIEEFETETNMPAEVRAIFSNNCYDCHSGVTTYPWYADIAPLSYWLNDHIKDGKRHFDVEDWNNYSLKKKDHKLDELIEEVEEGEMPLKSYTLVHGDLSDEEKELLENWAKEVRDQIQSEMVVQ
ncbi:cytochrome C [Dokdonia sp. Dokd-P16]|uniref:heme-binding domain-containing protein n=1 Tax=Dokdonia sp. Dokd-P16 TaxID=2173169 RepID=UPI000D547A28|nr:heme-binding domain-containing protein [Dokdonia sp. Dokd-P16]AWH74960.1 cytochrome C [Dokdonia sp. Dokd-P16]